MNCKAVQNRLSAYMDGELSGQEMIMVRHHLHCCAECSNELAKLQEVKSLIAEWSLPEIPDYFEERLVSRVFESGEARSRLLNFRTLLAGSLVTATITAALLIGVSPRYGAETVPAERSSVNISIERDQAFMAGADPTMGNAPMVLVNYDIR